MEINSDFRELLSVFNQLHVRYLVVGGYAVMKYTEPRYTKDLDIWVDPDPANAGLVYQALVRFGAPLVGITVKDFSDPETVYQLGVDPVRIDILKAVPGLGFNDAWQRRVESNLGDQIAFIISREDLVHSKRVTNRSQDRIDVKRLKSDRR